MDASSFTHLFHRCLLKTASSGEKNELLSHLHEHEDLFKQLVGEVFYQLDPAEDLSAETASALLGTIFSTNVSRATGSAEDDSFTLASTPRFYIRWLPYAAAVLLTLAAGIYLNRAGKKESPANLPVAQTLRAAGDLPPGGNKAMLTLADGSSIAIDSVPEGRIALQGGAVILKSPNGEIIYTADTANISGVPAYNTMRTPRGGQHRLALPDGSVVWLNAASSITFPSLFSGNERNVSMTGEAYYEIARDPARPFYVTIKDHLRIAVLGTSFNVNAYDDETSVNTVLIEGSVRVNDKNASRVLIPGQQARVSANGDITLRNDVDVQAEIAWKKGEFYFGEKADFGAIMRQIARWYDIEVEYHGNVTGHIGGSISRSSQLSTVLKMLEKAVGVKFEVQGRKVIVNP